MAMWGIGLGGFAKGFEHGVGLGGKMKKMGQEAELQGSLDDATKGAEAEVAAGRIKPGDVNAIMRFTLAKTAPALLRAGRPEDALKIGEWMQKNDTHLAVRAWGEGMLAAQAGDMKGALTNFASAGRYRGFGGYTFGDPQDAEGGGLSVTMTNKEGKDFTKVFRNAQEVAEFGAAFNPEWAGRNFLKQLESKRENGARSANELARKTTEQQRGLGRAPASISLQPAPGAAALPQQQQQQPSFTERWLGEGSPAPQLPQGAIDKLIAKPQLAPDFDRKYGAGAAARVLGGK